MLVASISIILFLLLFLIFFVVKNQGLQRELRKARYDARHAQKTAKYSLVTLDSLAQQVQKILLSQLESAQKRGLISGEEYEKAQAIFQGFETVIMSCCEHGSTIEEAVGKSLAGSDFSVDDINKFIATMPSEVRVAWVKNQVGSYVMACTNINNTIMQPRTKVAQTEAG